MAASLPTVGSDAGTWGVKLNSFISVGHNADGTHDITLNLVNGLVASLQDRIAVLEQQAANQAVYVRDVDPAADPNNSIVGGRTVWGDTSTGQWKARNNENTAWITFGSFVTPTAATDVLLNDDLQELQFDIIELTEDGKLADLEAVTTTQPTDLLAIVQAVNAIGQKITLANLLIDSIFVFSDVTTNDVDDTKHGFCPKLPGDPDLYLRGDGTWAAMP